MKLNKESRDKQDWAAERALLNDELTFQNKEKAARAAELILANIELEFQNLEKEKRATELVTANIELAFQNEKKEKRAAELLIANEELAFQNDEKEKRAAELVLANKELIFQNEEKEKRAAELTTANKELAKRALELIVANNELIFQNSEKGKRAAELIIANEELAFQNQEKEKRATELIIANRELVFQSAEKEKRADELIVANIELAFQNEEKGKRAAELAIANTELAFQNTEKEKRAAELIVVNNELIKAEEQFRLVVESAPNSMVLVNEEGIITMINSETEKLFGYDRRELIGNTLDSLIPSAVNKGHLFAMRKNGTYVQVEIGLNPIATAKGQMILASILDITERIIQEEVLREHNKELGQVVYVASHDLQEPLRTVSNYMEAFQEEYTELLDENARKYIGSINGAIKRMSLLIKSLLDFSKLGYNKKLTQVNCGKIISDVIADLGTMIRLSKAVIDVKQMPVLNMYEMEIRQLFQNLIVNAIKFRKIGVPPEITISAEPLNDKWKFSVADKGIGIDSAYFEKVFEIFQRLHSKHEYEGSGIGLANCKKIVQLHLGDIWIESTEGEGSTFYFTIANLVL